MPDLKQDKRELNAPQPDATADEVAGLLEVQQGEQPQSKRLQQNVSDDGSGGVAQGCSVTRSTHQLRRSKTVGPPAALALLKHWQRLALIACQSAVHSTRGP